MARYPSGYRTKDTPTIGVLSGWNKITTNKDDGQPVKMDHGFTIPDLLRLVQIVRHEFDPKKIATIEEMIERHVARQDNPHRVDLTQLGTSVLQELYKLWIDLGNFGTEEDFLKVLFQYVEIADIDETREGTAHDKVVHALGLATVVEDHDLDPYAHDALMERLFPGAPVSGTPTYALDAYVGVTWDMEVTRASHLWIINSKGLLEELGNDTIAPDYSTGVAAFPVFDTYTNLIGESENIANTNYWSLTSATIETSGTLYSFKDTPIRVLLERPTSDPVLHALTYKATDITQEKDAWYTISFFVTPHGRSAIGLKVTSNPASIYPWVHFDLPTGKIFTEDLASDISGTCYPLFDDWYRCQVTFKAAQAGKVAFQIYPLDIYDGDMTYEGVEDLGIGLFGIMVTKTAYLTPYVPSNNGITNTVQPTILKVRLKSSWWNKQAGTFVINATNVGVNTRLTKAATIFEVGSSTQIAMSASFPVGHENRVFLANYNGNNMMIAYKWMEASTRTWATIMQGFEGLQHVFGSTENDALTMEATSNVNQYPEYLYIGCTRYGTNQLNGFIRTLSYYPCILHPDNMPFFTGRSSSEVDF